MSEKVLDEYLRNWRTTRAREIMVEDVPPLPVYIIGAAEDGDTVQRIVNAAGEVTEANSLSTATSANAALNAQFAMQHPMYTPLGSWSGSAATIAAAPRRFAVPLTEAGGAIAATTIVPALAGYTGHCDVRGVYAPAGAADAATTWTFTVAAGTILGPDVFAMNIAAVRYHNFTAGIYGVDGPPVPLRGTLAADDNKAIQIEAAGLAVVGADYWVDGVYWYE